jgi:dolichol-phosphate mannosyltransferase
MLMLAIDAITSFSIVPLRIAASLGIVFGSAGFLILAYTLYSWAIGHVVQGWTSLAALVLIIGSVQMLILGVFGEYIGRMYIEVKRRPLYIVNQVIGLRDSERVRSARMKGKQVHA